MVLRMYYALTGLSSVSTHLNFDPWSFYINDNTSDLDQSQQIWPLIFLSTPTYSSDILSCDISENTYSTYISLYINKKTFIHKIIHYIQSLTSIYFPVKKSLYNTLYNLTRTLYSKKNFKNLPLNLYI